MAILQPILGRTIPLPEDEPDSPVVVPPVTPPVVTPTLPTIPSVIVDDNGKGGDKGDKPTPTPTGGTGTLPTNGNRSALVVFAGIALLVYFWS